MECDWALKMVWAAVATSLATAAAQAEGAKPPEPCTLDAGPKGTVARVIDGETIALEDGRLVRLMGTLAPRARDAGATAGAWPPENEAIKALTDLVLGKQVKLAFGGRRADRYGRLLAHLFIDDDSAQWVQGALLDSGNARVYGLSQSFACSAELLAHEEAARRQRLGLWNSGFYRPMPASKPEWLITLRGKYERVIGNVVSVGRTKSAAYLNFGGDYKTDFTARIGKSVLSANPDFASGLDALAAKTLVVRGWIERNNGPMIDIEDPSQIETVDSGDKSSTSSGPQGPKAEPSAPAATETPTPPPPSVPGAAKDLRPAPAEGPEPGAVNL